MTFSKSKIFLVWGGLLAALVIAIAGAVIGGSGDSQLGDTVAIVGLLVALLSVISGFFFVRCPACGKVLIRVMRPWKKGCVCPYCGTAIKYI